MAHIGFTPQSEHTLGGYRVQGRGDAAEDVVADARAVAEAGAFAVVLEMVPGEVAKRVTHELTIPTIGIGAGPRLRRPGAGLAGHGRAADRQAAPVRQAVRATWPTRSPTRRARTPTRCATGTFPGPEHGF